MIEKWFLKTHRLARTQTILDIALEDDAIGLSESECLVNALQGCAVGGKSEISSDQDMRDFLHLIKHFTWGILLDRRDSRSHQ